MKAKYIVDLQSEQKQYLENLTTTGSHSARQILRAQILLKSDQKSAGWSYEQIAKAFSVSQVTIAEVRKSFFEHGLEAALQRKKPNREYKKRIDGEAEAYLVSITCSEPPDGYERWSLRLLQREMVSRGYVQTVSHEAVRMVLKKMNLNLG